MDNFKKLRILIDLDGTVTHTLPEWLEEIGKKTGVYAKVTDITSYALDQCPPLTEVSREDIFDVLNQDGFKENLSLIRDASLIIRQLHEAGHEIYFVTARKRPESICATFPFMDKNFPFLDPSRIIFCQDKHLVKGDVLIEDNPAVMRKYKEEWPDALVMGFVWPYNKAYRRTLFYPLSLEIGWSNVLYPIFNKATGRLP